MFTLYDPSGTGKTNAAWADTLLLVLQKESITFVSHFSFSIYCMDCPPSLLTEILSEFSRVEITPVGVPTYSKNLLGAGAGVGSGVGCGAGVGWGAGVGSGAGFGSGVEESTYLGVNILTFILIINCPAVSAVVPFALYNSQNWSIVDSWNSFPLIASALKDLEAVLLMVKELM